MFAKMNFPWLWRFIVVVPFVLFLLVFPYIHYKTFSVHTDAPATSLLQCASQFKSRTTASRSPTTQINCPDGYKVANAVRAPYLVDKDTSKGCFVSDLSDNPASKPTTIQGVIGQGGVTIDTDKDIEDLKLLVQKTAMYYIVTCEKI